MYCPQCGTESQAMQYCRVCGANLKVIGKAVSLSEAIARSDRGPLPKLKEMLKGLNVDGVSEDVSRAMDRMKHELSELSTETETHDPWFGFRKKKKTPEERREDHLTKGMVSLFSGIGLGVFLYFLSAALVLKLPPDVIAQIPFELEPVVRIIWLFGLLPATAGIGHIVAGLLIRPAPQAPQLESPHQPRLESHQSTPEQVVTPRDLSVTDRTTNLLER